jgi:L-threonylcarbamoyladenylate synthase
MPRIINKDELKNEPSLVQELKNSIFIYPTDTIYGIGCDATNERLVKKVREIKRCAEKPFSVIIPNRNIIFSNCKTDERAKTWADKLPGPYTLIFNVKKGFFAKAVNPVDQTVGVRIPNHWFYNYVRKLQVPIVTTSANVTGDDFMTSLDDLNPDLKKKVDFIIYDGVLKGKPSTIVHLEKEEVEVRERG